MCEDFRRTWLGVIGVAPRCSGIDLNEVGSPGLLLTMGGRNAQLKELRKYRMGEA